MTLLPDLKRLDKDATMFWAKVDQSGDCWAWTASGTNNGYGQLSVDGKRFLAHRFSWTIHYGEIPDGMCVCHHCDNRACVRPDHLFLGTNRDNVDDMMRKGRVRKGTEVNFAKLDDDAVRAIRKLVAAGVTHRSCGERYGVSRSTVGLIINGRSWTHVKD